MDLNHVNNEIISTIQVKKEKIKETSFSIPAFLKKNERFLQKKKEKCKQPSLSFATTCYQLYSYADASDVLLMLAGLTAAFLNGILLPTVSLLFGGLANVFTAQFKYMNHTKYKSHIPFDKLDISPLSFSSQLNDLPQDFITEEYFYHEIINYTIYFVCLGLFVFISGFILVFTWELSCANRINKLKQIYFAQLLRQDLNWYDENTDGDLVAKITDAIERMRDGLGSKVPLLCQTLTTFVVGVVIGLIGNWRLALVLLIGSPLIIANMLTYSKVNAQNAMREQVRYGIAGKIANEVFSNIRTVTAFGTQNMEIKRFDEALKFGRKASMSTHYYYSISFALSTGLLYLMYAVGVWYAGNLYSVGEITPGECFTVLMSILTGALGIGNALPALTEVGNGIGAAINVLTTMNNQPKIDSYSEEGQLLDDVKGKIEFKDVFFCYSSRPEIMVLTGLNLVINPGQVIAIVGASGSGKSTIINLLLRFYDLLSGKVLIDDVNIKELNIGALRKYLGVVSQEPVLFDVSIEENIRYGNYEATDHEVRAAAIQANANHFIENLPNGYRTVVGERAVQLSGGQKQRIAIARALISNPKILLLDEATSALDVQNEILVQAALENAMQGRTTIIIAHRLSTIRNADVIYAMKDGKIVESGKHEELMELNGTYYNLVMTQMKLERPQFQSDTNADENMMPMNRYSFKRKSSRFRPSRLSVTFGSEDKGKLAEEKKQNLDEHVDISYFDLIKLNRNNYILFFGIFLIMICGLHIPIFSILYGNILKLFSVPVNEFHQAVLYLVKMFCLLAAVSAVAFLTAALTTNIGTENMIKKLRINIFENLLSQEISLFDEEEYSPFKLINLLSRDPPLIRCIAGSRLGCIMMSGVTLIVTLGIVFYYGWKLALIVTAFLPAMVYGHVKQNSIKYRQFLLQSAASSTATKIASECMQNVKTVQTLCLQEHMIGIFTNNLTMVNREEKKGAYVSGLAYSFATSIVFLMYGVTYRYGATLITEGTLYATDVYKITFTISFAAIMLGFSTVLLLDFSQAKAAVCNAARLIFIETELNPFSKDGTNQEIQGKIHFKDIWFTYPTRNQQILKGLDLVIEPGQTVALAGGSGNGKSTLIALLERFYFPDKGVILLDGVDISEINIGHLRNNLGLVTQEPVLFNTTIRENIVYGAKSLGRTITDHEIIQAAKAANIHDFIISLPQGYETKVGDRGSKLSGGQKQRVAIARALVRNPKILLLDEATSALDAESEQVVQAALDKAREGRTCIIIAHRLSTIQNADKIAVIHNGVVAEQGTHEELTAFGGIYYNLIKNQ